MKWTATSVSAACLAVGLGGFVVGRVSQGPSGTTEADELLARAQQVAAERANAGPAAGNARAAALGRPSRPIGSRQDSTFEQRLDGMEEIVRSENALARSRAMLSWIDSLAPSEFQAAVERFRSLGLTDGRMGEYAMLLTAWADADPLAAMAYTTANTSGGIATSTVLTAWASRDPDAAISWAKSNHSGDGPNPHMVGIIRGLVETNPGRATELLQNLPYSRERGEALQAMIPHLMKMGPESAKAWIAGLEDKQLKDGAIGRLAEALASEDPAGTAAWLLKNLNDTSARSVDNVFQTWGQKDMAAALDSLDQLPAGETRGRALRGLVIVEARQNPEAGAKLMNQYPADVDDQMVQHFIWNSFAKAPEIAVSQIARMVNPERQNRMYERALDAWLDRDEAAAQRWIDSAELPASVVERLAQRNQP